MPLPLPVGSTLGLALCSRAPDHYFRSPSSFVFLFVFHDFLLYLWCWALVAFLRPLARSHALRPPAHHRRCCYNAAHASMLQNCGAGAAATPQYSAMLLLCMSDFPTSPLLCVLNHALVVMVTLTLCPRFCMCVRQIPEQLEMFATLSPIPSFREWLGRKAGHRAALGVGRSELSGGKWACRRRPPPPPRELTHGRLGDDTEYIHNTTHHIYTQARRGGETWGAAALQLMYRSSVTISCVEDKAHVDI